MGDVTAQGHRVENTMKLTLTDTVGRDLFVQTDGAVCGAGERANGVSLESGVATDHISVQIAGVARVIAGGACTVGGPACSDADGKAVDVAASEVILGHFLTGTTQAGDPVLINLWAN